MGNFKKIIFGEEMPDKNDPKYKDKYENDVEAGRKFAKVTHLDKLAGHIQMFASKHTKLFLTIVFGIVLTCFTINISNLYKTYRQQSQQKSATEIQEQRLKEKLNQMNPLTPHSEDGNTK